MDYNLYSTKALNKIADKLAADIILASQRDRVYMQELEKQLTELNNLIMIRMSNENDIWLESTKQGA
jgi:hypothetical protein